MKDPKNIAVVGVSGYTGFELAKILLRHPAAEKLTFYVREPAWRALLDGIVSTAARVGAGAGEGVVGRSDRGERSGYGVFGDAA